MLVLGGATISLKWLLALVSGTGSWICGLKLLVRAGCLNMVVGLVAGTGGWHWSLELVVGTGLWNWLLELAIGSGSLGLVVAPFSRIGLLVMELVVGNCRWKWSLELES